MELRMLFMLWTKEVRYGISPCCSTLSWWRGLHPINNQRRTKNGRSANNATNGKEITQLPYWQVLWHSKAHIGIQCHTSPPHVITNLVRDRGEKVGRSRPLRYRGVKLPLFNPVVSSMPVCPSTHDTAIVSS